jgi:predicted nucleic-acid-binding Zn-ribbon protein
MRYKCKICNWELDQIYLTDDAMQKIFKHEKEHND